ncbi:MAG: Hpt domain-containing protein [Cyanobacteria bacterium P01_H01_bin.130]
MTGPSPSLSEALEQLPRPLFDTQLLLELIDVIGAESAIAAIPELITLFAQDAPQYRTAILTAIAQEDGDTLRRSAHTLKSSSRSLGAAGLGQVCEALEECAIKGRFDLARQQHAEFEPLLDQSLTILNQLAQRLQ